MKGIYLGDFVVECTPGERGEKVTTHAPKEVGGLGHSFSPTDLLALALGSCMLTLIGMEAKKLGVEVGGTTFEIEKEMASFPPRRIGKFIIRVRSPHSFSAQVREKLEKAALECPVKHSLHPDIRKEIDFVWGL